ncbi:hypothetical protein EZ428_21645 [Pedobacter frigiditerrae]|uniref:Uncharacterized protein n=1 Tax=Pedobacter frigiditerrae TaxID=2530452 RepID=A0A4V2MHP4_9SPHI|nr:hypothetical protein [Pedobacter frigiditerrae]TCC87306.1 hypothetical protein EZ428_21645 [Pedobacter frigiditerrae]
MKYFFIAITLFFANALYAQNYPNLLNYNLNSTHTHGIKIKTNLPFTPGSQMPTIKIEGYNFGTGDVISLNIVYYIYSGGTDYNNPSNYYLYDSKVSSLGSYTPKVLISNENGKVVIYLDDKVYHQRFTVSAFAQGMQEVPAWFQGWTVVDEPLTGTQTTELAYKNRFKGDVYMPESGIWNTLGNVGIGTTNPTEKLSVNGKIRAKEIKIEPNPATWPDYVFEADYKVGTLEELERYITTHKHLPEIPSAKEVESNGLELGEMNRLLLKKVEELTLYLIQKDKELVETRKAVDKTRADLSEKLALQEARLLKIENLIKK